MSSRLRGDLLLLLTATIWGLAFVAQRVGADHMGPLAFNGVRFGLGAISLLPVIVAFDHLRTRRGEPADRTGRLRAALVPGIVAGLVLFTASWLQQWGLNWTTAGKAGFITGLYIVLVPILGIALRHRTGLYTWIGALTALVGLYVLSVRDGFTIEQGDGLVLVSSVLWATHILLVDRFTGLDALRFSAVQFATTSLVSLAAAVAFESAPFAGIEAAAMPIFYGGVLSVGVAYTLQVFGQRDAAPSAAAIILSMEAVFAAIGGIVLLGEPLTWREMTGFGLMFAGIVISQRTPPAPVATAPVSPSGTVLDEHGH